MRGFVVLLQLVAVASCGDNTPPGPDAIDGARLRNILYRFTDGTTLRDPATLRDGDRGEDCRIRRFSSGTRRCMPITAGSATVFTDDRCTRVLGERKPSEPEPAYFIRYYSLQGALLPSRLYRAGAPTTAPAATWRQQDRDCLGPFPPDVLGTYYELGEEVTPDALAEVRTVATLEETRLSLALDGSDDGWRGPGELTDRATDEPCAVLGTYCVPTNLPLSSYYADSACSLGLATAPRSLQVDIESGCAVTLIATDAYTGSVSERIGESCVTAPPESAVYEATVLLAATVTRTALGTGRIRPYELSRGPVRIGDGHAYDVTLATDCHVEARDGGYVCVPDAPVLARTYFSDASCTTPVDVTFVPTGACEAPVHYARDAAGVRPIGDVRSAPIYELTTGDRCAAYVPPPRFAVHALGPVVAPADYAAAYR